LLLLSRRIRNVAVDLRGLQDRRSVAQRDTPRAIKEEIEDRSHRFSSPGVSRLRQAKYQHTALSM
jgi:hypothetical protein